ncbi:hypothetical protein [Chitinophaga agri]|uniref:Uncharacterized protein n=1 Tax=Chitinophaga agri TaxID=2703787 RepID=A0A6B9ZB61_9BACT|nr:hypothetical protein [Chitinophaga agri]QHS59528.1 hypothetical protein GWR21_07975 [Chitinophaga agri]
MVSSIIFAGGSKLIAQLWGNNLWFYNTMYFIAFVILSLYFHAVIKYKTVRNTILGMIFPVLAFVILDYVTIEGPNQFNSYAISAQTFILMIYCAIFFYQLLRDDELVKQSVFINSLPDFWYNSGIFVYHCGYFLFSLAYNLMNFGYQGVKGSTRLTLAITFIAGIIQLVLLYIGLTKVKKIRS